MSKTVVPLSMSNLPATTENVSKQGILVSFKNPLRQVAAVKACRLDNKVAGQICISLRLREATNLYFGGLTDRSLSNFPSNEGKHLDSMKRSKLFSIIPSGAL